MGHDFRGRYAGFVSRAAALIIDALIITAALTIAAWALSITLELLRSTDSQRGFSPSVDLSAWVIAIAIPLTWVLYHASFWAMVGKTPGKALLGLRVERLDGDLPSFGRSLLRVLAYGVSMILFLGFFWVLIDTRRMGWHDKIAGTCVIYDWDARAFDRQAPDNQPATTAPGSPGSAAATPAVSTSSS